MAFDGILLHLVKEELSEKLRDARIDRIYQMSRDEIVLDFRKAGGSERLLISANPSGARINLTEQRFENPKNPPMFCMLLRKYLNGAKLISIRQPDFERILYFDFDAANEIGDRIKVILAAEIMGRHSNIILLNGDSKVIDAVKRVDEEISSVRLILPGVFYYPPPKQEKNLISEGKSAEVVSRIVNSNKELSKALLDGIKGISPIVAREIAFRVYCFDEKPASELSSEEKDRLIEELDRIKQYATAKKADFCAVFDEMGKPLDFSFFNLLQYGKNFIVKHYDSSQEMLDRFYEEKERTYRIRQKSGDLYKIISNLRERTLRRVEVQKLELEKSKGRDQLRVFGDLISANLYLMKKGDLTLKTIDFYTGDEVVIPLDASLTPNANAQKYYSMYKRESNAEKNLTAMIQKGEQEILYIESIADSLERSNSEQDLLDLWDECKSSGYIKASRGKSPKFQKQKPYHYMTSDGYEILVGRNNRQNDELTFHTARNKDLWFHVKNNPGSHVILLKNGEEISENAMVEAAEIAAFHSRASQSSGVPVDYTEAKNIKKIPGAMPGMVTYSQFRTVYVTPDEKKILKLKK